jgi:hypothetical protein
MLGRSTRHAALPRSIDRATKATEVLLRHHESASERISLPLTVPIDGDAIVARSRHSYIAMQKKMAEFMTGRESRTPIAAARAFVHVDSQE